MERADTLLTLARSNVRSPYKAKSLNDKGAMPEQDSSDCQPIENTRVLEKAALSSGDFGQGFKIRNLIAGCPDEIADDGESDKGVTTHNQYFHARRGPSGSIHSGQTGG